MLVLVLSMTIPCQMTMPALAEVGETKLLAKGHGCFVHAVPSGVVHRGAFGATAPVPYRGGGFPGVSNRYVITHLDGSDGTMTRLVSGGEWGFSWSGGLDHHLVFQHSIMATHADDNFFYVWLARHSYKFDSGMDKHGKPGTIPKDATIPTAVQVFKLKTGQLIADVNVPTGLDVKMVSFNSDQVDDNGWLTTTKETLIVGDAKKPLGVYEWTKSMTLEFKGARK